MRRLYPARLLGGPWRAKDPLHPGVQGLGSRNPAAARGPEGQGGLLGALENNIAI